MTDHKVFGQLTLHLQANKMLSNQTLKLNVLKTIFIHLGGKGDA